MRAHRTLIVSLVITLALAAPAVAAGSRLLIGGSTSVLPLMQKLAAAYHKAYPKIPEPQVEGGQSDIGIEGVIQGRFNIGDSSRNPLPTEEEPGAPKLTWTKIAEDGVCIITNKSNPVPNLTEETVQEIFTGALRDWSEVPGANISGPIDLFDRDSASGTQDAFQHIFLGEEKKISPSATAEASNGLEQNAIAADKNAIGFVSFAFTSGVHTVDYEGVTCNLANARSGQYAGVRNFWMVTKGAPKGEALKFIDWVTSGNKSTKSIISSSWITIH